MPTRFFRATAPILGVVALLLPHAVPSSADEPPPLVLLDVPFLAQHDALCGGASLAMVLRYWGDDRALPDDFTHLLNADRSGILPEDLKRAATEAGCEAFGVVGDTAWARQQLGQGRPLIVLVHTGQRKFHYEVLVGMRNDEVIVHDPAIGPFRTQDRGEFDREWSEAARWALLLVPLEGADHAPPRTPPALLTGSTAGNSLVQAGVVLAEKGRYNEARESFRAAHLLDPASSAPLREWAGLEFRVDEFSRAIDLARQATELDPADTLSWQILAGSAFLHDDTDLALEAWNRIGEPKRRSASVRGLRRTRQPAVERTLGLPARKMITARGFGIARRRLRELPAVSSSNLTLRPQSNGWADLDAAVAERVSLLDGGPALAALVPPALIDQEVRTGLTSPTGQGERFDFAWRWSKNRPKLLLAARVPGAFGIRGRWSAEGVREKEAYDGAIVAGGVAGAVVREERKRAELSWSDWLDPLVRLGLDAGYDRWDGLGSYLSAGMGLTFLAAHDHFGLRGHARGWFGLDGEPGFGSVQGVMLWRSSLSPRDHRWMIRGEASWTEDDAPLSLWSGAGTGLGRAPLLRAHPLLDDGIIIGPAFGPTLIQGTVERLQWLKRGGSVRVGGAAFVDAAQSGPASLVELSDVNVDAGVGLRFGWPGGGQIRIDRAWSLTDDAAAWSIGWEETLLH